MCDGGGVTKGASDGSAADEGEGGENGFECASRF